MSNTWIVDLTHFLAPGGAIAPICGHTRQLAEYWTSIVVHASTNLDDEVMLHCRRPSGPQPCAGSLTISIELDTDAIHWVCPVCGDNGIIRGWQGTLWDGFTDGPLAS